jgi:hypothetical protein
LSTNELCKGELFELFRKKKALPKTFSTGWVVFGTAGSFPEPSNAFEHDEEE